MFKWYEKPGTATAEGWHKWQVDTKANFPVQYFFRETLRTWFSVTIVYKIERAYWWFIHRFHPKHRYHVIKPRSLKPGYHDPCTRIFHTVFDELSKYAENKLMGNGVNGTRWTQEDIDEMPEEYNQKQSLIDQVEVEAKIIALRNWWVDVYPNREDEYPDLDGVMDGKPMLWNLIPEYKETEDYKKFRAWADEMHRIEDAHDKENKEKLKEAIDLLDYLWY